MKIINATITLWNFSTNLVSLLLKKYTGVSYKRNVYEIRNATIKFCIYFVKHRYRRSIFLWIWQKLNSLRVPPLGSHFYKFRVQKCQTFFVKMYIYIPMEKLKAFSNKMCIYYEKKKNEKDLLTAYKIKYFPFFPSLSVIIYFIYTLAASAASHAA